MAGTFRRLLDPGDWIAIKPQLDPQATALQINYAPARTEIKLRIGAGLTTLTVFFAVCFFFRDDVFFVLIFCGLGFFGLLNLIYGVIQSGFSMSLLITGTEVAMDSRTLLGRRQWREWLSNYRGVLLCERHLRESEVGSTHWTKRYHIVELVHDDAAKTVPLYVKEGGPPPRHIQEALARRFSLPALSPDSSGLAARPVAELDRSLRDRAVPVADPGPPPSGVLVRQEGGTTRLTIGTGRLGRILVWLFWLSLPPLIGRLVCQLDPVFGYIAAGMVILFVLMMQGLGKLMGGGKKESQRAICIDASRVWIDQPVRRDPAVFRYAIRTMSRITGLRPPPMSPPASSLARSAVEQVRVDVYTSHDDHAGDFDDGLGGPTYHPRLVIEGDEGTLEFIGAQFDRKKLEWVRDYLRYRLTNP